MKTFKKISSLLNVVNELNVQQIIKEKVYLKEVGWTKIKISDEIKEEIFEKTSQLFGGFNVTKKKIKRALFNNAIHWSLERVEVKLINKEISLKYFPGQDKRSEFAGIRKDLKNS